MQNLIVEVHDLPSIKALTKEPLARHYAIVNLFASSIVFVVLAIAVFIGRTFILADGAAELEPIVTYLPIFMIVFGALYCSYQWFADKAKYFSIRQHDISFFSGVFFKKLVTQPISRIQHVEVSQGPVDRVADLGKLQVYSAGSAMQTFAIPGLPIEIAHQLRQQLTQKLNDDLDENEQDD